MLQNSHNFPARLKKNLFSPSKIPDQTMSTFNSTIVDVVYTKNCFIILCDEIITEDIT